MAPSPTISEAILHAAAERGADKSTCPSEVARSLFPVGWRSHMQEIRDAAIKLHKEGKVVITQKRTEVDPDNIRGPIRIKISPGRGAGVGE